MFKIAAVIVITAGLVLGGATVAMADDVPTPVDTTAPVVVEATPPVLIPYEGQDWDPSAHVDGGLPPRPVRTTPPAPTVVPYEGTIVLPKPVTPKPRPKVIVAAPVVKVFAKATVGN